MAGVMWHGHLAREFHGRLGHGSIVSHPTGETPVSLMGGTPMPRNKKEGVYLSIGAFVLFQLTRFSVVLVRIHSGGRL